MADSRFFDAIQVTTGYGDLKAAQHPFCFMTGGNSR